MAYCKNCGNAIYDGDKFCRRCGMKVEEPTVTPPPPPTDHQPPQQPTGYQQMPSQQPAGYPPPPQQPMGGNPYGTMYGGSDVMASGAEGEITMGNWQIQNDAVESSNNPSRVRQIIGWGMIAVSVILLGIGIYSLINSLGKGKADTEIKASPSDSTSNTVTEPQEQPIEKPAEPAKPAEPETGTNTSVIEKDTPTPPVEDVQIREEPQPRQTETMQQQRSGESIVNSFGPNTDEEARALVRKMQARGDITPEEAAECMRYINSRGNIGQ